MQKLKKNIYILPSNRPATPLFSPACWQLGFQAWAQSTRPELAAQGLVPLRWGCALPSPNAPGMAPNHINTTLRWGRAPGKPLPQTALLESPSSAPLGDFIQSKSSDICVLNELQALASSSPFDYATLMSFGSSSFRCKQVPFSSLQKDETGKT